jgi:plastocyanin
MRRTAILIGLTMLAAACGGGGGGSNQSPSRSASSTGGSTANCADLSSGPVFTLIQQNIAFHPKCLKVKSAQSIKIVNQDSVLHNFTITGTQVDVDIQPGTTFHGESAGLAPGTYQFFCKFHKARGMTGTIVVT